ncbi:hypothetical protein GQ54DRAFT_297241 [Martensiomyces pterosporus]|nr:hypothetical protein GQ54DRAFT_297241 [Martensiomyces pterosporus]
MKRKLKCESKHHRGYCSCRAFSGLSCCWHSHLLPAIRSPTPPPINCHCCVLAFSSPHTPPLPSPPPLLRLPVTPAFWQPSAFRKPQPQKSSSASVFGRL